MIILVIVVNLVVFVDIIVINSIVKNKIEFRFLSMCDVIIGVIESGELMVILRLVVFMLRKVVIVNGIEN